MLIKIICAAIALGALALAGCGAASHGATGTRPAPTVTRTVTPSASPSGASSPAPGVTRTVTVTPAPPAGGPAIRAHTPWSVVSEYYGDIESGDYADAYALLSSGSVTGQTYQQFVNGFACTTYDDLADLGTAGNTVTISLEAAQCDGTVNQYQGTYTVQNGLITAADITRTG
jgi:hypothetical protein